MSLCRRRWAGQFWSPAAVRRRSNKICGGEKIFSKIPEKISFYPENFMMTFFSHRRLQQNKYTATMTSTARRQIIGHGGGTPVNRCRRLRRLQIVGGGCAAQGSIASIT